MKDEEILKKAIEKTVKGGYSHWKWGSGASVKEVQDYCKRIAQGHLYYGIIFSHDFAKAFWGDKIGWLNLAGQYEKDIPIYLYHLQQMVLEKEPLKYLEKFL